MCQFPHCCVISGITILDPKILILTKLQRWSTKSTPTPSTRPNTGRKLASDKLDIEYLIGWLAKRDEVISFDNYPGKTKAQFLVMLRKYYDQHASQDSEQANALRKVMSDDWEEMLAL